MWKFSASERTTYSAMFSYNGSYRGKGKYLTGVAVVPTATVVAWGHKLNMRAAVPDSTITNVGTDTDPIAAMQMKFTWRIVSPIKVIEGASVYYVRGDGYFEEIASLWRNIRVEDVKAAAPLLEPGKVF